VRRAQYRIADDEPAARGLARAFVDGKIANMRVSLLRADLLVASTAETLAITRLVPADAASYDVILGHEGTATCEYFRTWRRIIGDDWGLPPVSAARRRTRRMRCRRLATPARAGRHRRWR
jgi:CRISPR-associated protein Cas1